MINQKFPILTDEVHMDSVFGKCIPTTEDEFQRMEQLIYMFPEQAFILLGKWIKAHCTKGVELQVYDHIYLKKVKP